MGFARAAKSPELRRVINAIAAAEHAAFVTGIIGRFALLADKPEADDRKPAIGR